MWVLAQVVAPGAHVLAARAAGEVLDVMADVVVRIQPEAPAPFLVEEKRHVVGREELLAAQEDVVAGDDSLRAGALAHLLARPRGDEAIALAVDRVVEVLDIEGENIEGPPQFGSSVNTSFILGMGKIDNSVKILLDIDKVLTSEELVQLQTTTEV